MTNIPLPDGVPPDFSEEFFQSADKCKAKGIITAIKKTTNRNDICFNLRIELKDSDAQYSIYGVGNNPGCPAKLGYNLSGDNFPKIGDTLYAISSYSSYEIFKLGEDSYNENINLPNCYYEYENPFGGLAWDEPDNNTLSNSGTQIITGITDTEVAPMKNSIKMKEKTTTQNSTSVKTTPKVIQEKTTTQSSTGKIVVHSNSGIVNTSLATVLETNTGGLIESGILVNSGNLVKIEDIQNTSNSGIETRYQTGLTQEEKQEPPKVQAIHNTQNYYLYGIIVVLLIIIVFGVRKLYFSQK